MKFFCVFISLIISSSCFSQNKFTLKSKVVAAYNLTPLQRVNIKVLNKALGASSNSYGNFSITFDKFSKNDTLVFSHLGYKTIKLPISKVLNTTVKLKLKEIKLPEVKLTEKNTHNKILKLNKFKPKKTIVLRSKKPFNGQGTLWVHYREHSPTIETMYFPYDSNYGEFPKIKKVLIKFETLKDTSKVKLRIFKGKEDFSPSMDVIVHPITLQVIRGESFVEVDLDEYDITMPKTGIYIGLEHLYIPENTTIVKSIPKELKLETTVYWPFLSYVKAKEPNYSYYIYSKDNWSKVSKKILGLKKYDYYKPAITLLLERDN